MTRMLPLSGIEQYHPSHNVSPYWLIYGGIFTCPEKMSWWCNNASQYLRRLGSANTQPEAYNTLSLSCRTKSRIQFDTVAGGPENNANTICEPGKAAYRAPPHPSQKPRRKKYMRVYFVGCYSVPSRKLVTLTVNNCLRLRHLTEVACSKLKNRRRIMAHIVRTVASEHTCMILSFSGNEVLSVKNLNAWEELLRF
jgi:hypothetical protein